MAIWPPLAWESYFFIAASTRGELVLDLAALVAADAGELLVGVGELVVFELKLGLGDVEVVGVGDGCRWAA